MEQKWRIVDDILNGINNADLLPDKSSTSLNFRKSFFFTILSAFVNMV